MQEARVSKKGKEMVANKVQAFKIACEDKIRRRRTQAYGEKQFENGNT